MASNYPDSLDSFAAPGAQLAGPPTHSAMHTNVQDAIVAVETTLGLDPQGSSASVAARLDIEAITICTSSTRPAAPTRGKTIFETDTGNLLVYYGATTGWKPPWSVSWGRLTATSAQTTVTAAASGIGTVEALVNIFSAGVPTLANRSYKITAEFVVRALNNVTSFASFRVRRTNLAGAVVLGPIEKAKNAGAAGLARETVTLTAYDTPGVQASQSWCVSAQTDASTIDIFNPSLVIVEDLGPTGNAPAS